jgi:hypothetical protein
VHPFNMNACFFFTWFIFTYCTYFNKVTHAERL